MQGSTLSSLVETTTIQLFYNELEPAGRRHAPRQALRKFRDNVGKARRFPLASIVKIH
jgi:hypothetical protein